MFRLWRNEKRLVGSALRNPSFARRTSKSKTRPFPFRHAERGNPLQNGALAREARLPRRVAPRQSLPKMRKL